MSRMSRLPRLSRSSVSFVYFLRLSHASISCVYLMRLVYFMRLSRSYRFMRLGPHCSTWSALFVSSALLCNPLTLTLVYSFKHVKPVNSFKRLSCSSCSYRPPKLFERFDPFQAFDFYNYSDNSSVSIGLKCLPPRALQRVKINFFKRREKPERFEVFNLVEVFGEYGEYGEIKGVRRVRGKHS